MAASCGNCRRSLARPDRKVKCSGPCARAFHLLCADLNVSFWRAATARVGLFWFCPGCRVELERKKDKASTTHSHSDVSDRIEKLERETGELPAELWHKVFQALDGNQLRAIRMTCRGWNQIVGSSCSLMNKLVLRLPKDIIVDQYCGEVKLLAACESRYVHLVMDQLRIIRVDASWWASFALNLKSLSITGCRITVATLLTMLEPLHNLKSLTLASGPLIDARECPSVISFQLPSLEKLALQEADQGDLLDLFRQLCPRLKVFEMPTGSCAETHSDKVAQFVEATKGTLVELELPMLRRLWGSIMGIGGVRLRRVTLTGCISGGMQENLVEMIKKYPDIQILQFPENSFLDKSVRKND